MPVDHHPPWHMYICECQKLQDIHHQYQEEEVQEEEEDFSSI